MATPTLIFCAAGNPIFAEIAVRLGFKYGARLPAATYADVYFADQDWKNPDRARYMRALEQHRPQMATVLDWERIEQWGEVWDWAQEAAQWVEQVIVIPKVPKIDLMPESVSGKPIILGFSVPTQHGGTALSPVHLQGRKIHLLGGSPQMQMRLARQFARFGDVVSVDGNMAQKMATTRNCYWRQERQIGERGGQWWTLEPGGTNRPARCLERSLANIATAWRNVP